MSQEVLGWGWLAWAGGNACVGPHVMESLSELGGIQQIACAERCLLSLTRSGKVYCLYYSSETQVGLHYIPSLS